MVNVFKHLSMSLGAEFNDFSHTIFSYFKNLQEISFSKWKQVADILVLIYNCTISFKNK